MSEEKIILNGKEVSKEELEKAKERANNTPGVKLLEIAKNVYMQRIQG